MLSAKDEAGIMVDPEELLDANIIGGEKRVPEKSIEGSLPIVQAQTRSVLEAFPREALTFIHISILALIVWRERQTTAV